MSNKFLTEVNGFTPVIDVMARQLGLIPAVVYGVVWRYCQMEDHVCSASLERLAEHVGVDRKTVERHIKALCDAGYLEAVPIISSDLLHSSDNHGRCEYCGIDFGYPDKHHIIPLSEGGHDTPDNITYLCPNCHRLVHLTGYVANCKIARDGWMITEEEKLS